MHDIHLVLYRGPSIERATAVTVCTDSGIASTLADRATQSRGEWTTGGRGALAFLAFYHGPIENAPLANVTSDPSIVAEFVNLMLASPRLQLSDDADPITAAKMEAERKGMEVVLEELDAEPGQAGPRLVKDEPEPAPRGPVWRAPRRLAFHEPRTDRRMPALTEDGALLESLRPRVGR